MSNQHVGAVYAQIIEDVIDSSRVDFEEGGIEERILLELQKVSKSQADPDLLLRLPNHFPVLR